MTLKVRVLAASVAMMAGVAGSVVVASPSAAAPVTVQLVTCFNDRGYQSNGLGFDWSYCFTSTSDRGYHRAHLICHFTARNGIPGHNYTRFGPWRWFDADEAYSSNAYCDSVADSVVNGWSDVDYR